MDGDTEYPTICGTGTEDYFCGSYNFEDPHTHQDYVNFTTPYGGIYTVGQDRLYKCQKRFGLYRFHIADPIRFNSDLRVTIQALGWREGGRYLPYAGMTSPRWRSGIRPCPQRRSQFWEIRDYLEVI